MPVQDGNLAVSTLSFVGRIKEEIVEPSDIEVKTTHPLSNWYNTSTGSAFYVHTDWAEGEAVLKELMPMLPPKQDEQASEKEKNAKSRVNDDL